MGKDTLLLWVLGIALPVSAVVLQTNMLQLSNELELVGVGVVVVLAIALWLALKKSLAKNEAKDKDKPKSKPAPKPKPARSSEATPADRFCSTCGRAWDSSIQFCPSCGKEVA